MNDEQAITTVLPGGVRSPTPPNVELIRGQGCYCYSADGRRFCDFVAGYGPVILGHADVTVNAAVAAQLQCGVMLPGTSSMSPGS